MGRLRVSLHYSMLRGLVVFSCGRFGKQLEVLNMALATLCYLVGMASMVGYALFIAQCGEHQWNTLACHRASKSLGACLGASLGGW